MISFPILKVPHQEITLFDKIASILITSKNEILNPIYLPYHKRKHQLKIDENIPFSLVSEEESEFRILILLLGFAIILLLTSSVFCIISYPIMVENSPQVIVVLPISSKKETSNPMGKTIDQAILEHLKVSYHIRVIAFFLHKGQNLSKMTPPQDVLGHRQSYTLSICTYFLKNQVRRNGFLTCKNQYRN